MNKLIICAVIALTISSAAFSQTLESKNLMQNLATLTVASKWCEDYKIDVDGMVQIAILADVNISKEPNKAYFVERRKEYEGMMGQYGMNAFCAAAYKRFGPGGPISGLMMKK